MRGRKPSPPPPPPPPPSLPAGLAIQPSSLAEDARGSLWFTILGIPKAGRLDRNGSLSEFSLPPVSFGANVIYGSDGNLWMVGITTLGSMVAGNIIKLAPAGTSTFYELPDTWVPEGLTAGPDGNLWFTAWEGANPDGAVAIGQITTAGAVTIFPLPERATGPATITSGPEHSLWFTESPVGRIGRAALHGKVLEYHLPRKGSLPAQIAAGADGNIWFTENFSDRVARMTPKGIVTEFTLPVSGKYEAIRRQPMDRRQFSRLASRLGTEFHRRRDRTDDYQRRGDGVPDSERRRRNRPHRTARRHVVVLRTMGDGRVDPYRKHHHGRPNHRDIAQPRKVTRRGVELSALVSGSWEPRDRRRQPARR
jgi:streptogramin lyase